MKTNTVSYKYSQYADANAYLDADATYTDLKDKADHPTFEWTKDMMLYAVSDALVNKASGSSTQTDGLANVLAKNNVTLTSAKGAVGAFDDTITDEISVADLTGNKQIESMKKLMNMGASDVTAIRENGKLTKFQIKRNMPLGVKAEGTLDVQAGGDVFVAGRTDAEGNHSAINIGAIDATNNSAKGDVRLHSAEGIYNAKTANDTNITGNNLILTGGKESIGKAETPLTVSLTGDITEARADKNVYIKNVNDNNHLRLGAMYAGDTISLESKKGFLMREYKPDEDIAESYINAGKNLVFLADANTGVVGDADHAIRILNDRAPVSIEAGSAYIRGVGSPAYGIQNGTLILGTINTSGEFTATSDGSLAVVGQEEETDSAGNVVKPAVEGKINSGGNVTLSAADSLTLDGTVTAGNLTSGDAANPKTLTLKAVNGDITQTDKGVITADAVNTFNGKSLLLENANNQFNSITVDGIETETGKAIEGNVRIKDNSDALTVAVSRDVTGDISVVNLRENGTLTNSGNLTATGNIGLKADGDLTQAAGTTLNAGNNVTLTSNAGNVAAKEATAKNDVTLKAEAGSVAIDGAVTSTAGNVTATAKSAVTSNADVKANKNVTLTSTEGAITVKNIGATTGNIKLKANDNLTQAANTALTAGKAVKLTSENENITLGTGSTIKAKDDSISLDAKNNILLENNVSLTADNVNLASHTGGITQNMAPTGSIAAGNVTASAATGVHLDATGNAFNAITVNASGENASINGNVTIRDNADTLELSIKPVVKGDVIVENGVYTTNETGNIDYNGDKIQEGTSAGVIHVNSDIQAKGNGTADSGDITLKSKGTMQTTGKLTAADDVNLTSTSGNVTISGNVSTGMLTPKLVDTEVQTDTELGGEVIKIPTLSGEYSALVIHAGGAIQETDGVKIDTPVVETYSGKGVSMESKNNTFAFFLADAREGSKEINGNIKAVSSYAGGEDKVFVAGVGASVRGDVEFTNLHKDGGLGLLLLHPEREDEIKILDGKIPGGNGAQGSLTLKAVQNVTLLGDADAAHDIVIETTADKSAGDGTVYGVGRGMKAGHDVRVLAGDAVYYIGTITAGNDINIQVQTPISTDDDSGIYIGALAETPSGVDSKPTSLVAGNDARFAVNGNGHIALAGNVIAKTGDVDANISGTGEVAITKTIESKNGSVSVKTGTGDINIGVFLSKEEETIKAAQNVKVETDLGTVYILGKTITQDGDITMKAGKDRYQADKVSGEGIEQHGNFIIDDDGMLISGGGVGLYGRNGDIHITDDIKAKKGLTASITEQGNVYFDTNVSVTNDVNITTDKGDIEVGHTVNAETGTVKMQTRDGDISIGADVTAGGDVDMKTAIKGDITVGAEVTADTGSVKLQTGEGDISIGADVTAGNDVKMKVNTGDVTVGDGVTGDDAGSSGQGNVVAKNGDVTVDISGKGNVGITKSVDSQNGSVSVKTKEGNINIGSANVKDDKTVTAKENVNVETDLGTIYILGMTSTEKGDITMKAGKDSYQADEGSGEDLVQNGNFIIKDDGKVNSGGAVNLKGRNGDIHITEAIEAKKGITASITEKGNVYFDREVNVKDDVNITTEDGSIAIGKTVTSTEGNVNLQTGTGSILIGQDVTAEKDITITTKEGSVIVGDTDTGGDGDVLSKKGDVSIQTGEGVVGIVKSVKAQEGSIDIQVGTGGVAIGNNGPGVETVSAYKNIDVAVDLGRIEINGKTSTKKGDISMSAAESEYVPGGQNIIIAQNGELDSGRDARLTGRNGDLHVTDAVKAVRNLNAKVLDEGDIVYDKTVNVNGDVTAKTDKGSISVAKEVTGNLVDLDTGKGNITVSGDIRSNTDVTMHTGTGDISVKNVNAQGNTTISDTGRGNVNGKNIVSGGTTHVSLTKGDLFLNLAEGKAVVLRMEDNTKASKVGTVLADASGGAGPDVELTGNYIPIGTLAAKNGNAVFEVTAMGANNQKLISGEITVGSLRSRTNTHMPTLWANRGNIHVDEGDLAIDDVLAVDKIHLENKLTDLAIFGRTPTRDGEQLYYWNNLELANSKTRSFTLYANGKVRTHRAVLIDAGRYYGKLYGDNLSVVDMMRERLTNEHGQYTFDRTWYTKPGEALKEKVLFGMDTVDEDIRRHNASSGQLM